MGMGLSKQTRQPQFENRQWWEYLIGLPCHGYLRNCMNPESLLPQLHLPHPRKLDPIALKSKN